MISLPHRDGLDPVCPFSPSCLLPSSASSVLSHPFGLSPLLASFLSPWHFQPFTPVLSFLKVILLSPIDNLKWVSLILCISSSIFVNSYNISWVFNAIWNLFVFLFNLCGLIAIIMIIIFVFWWILLLFDHSYNTNSISEDCWLLRLVAAQLFRLPSL